MNALTIQNHLEMDISEEKIELMKRTFCKSSTDEEFALFLHACARTGLDPFMRQIYAVKRWDGALKREVMSVQTGIDGYRLIADRTGRYSPGKETIFSYDENGWPVSATAFIKKQTPDGTWHEISATAYMREYCAYTEEGKPTHMWGTKPHIMLGKCAEALALRKAFPAELSGLYTKEEMEQADNGKGESKIIAIEEEKQLSDDEIEKYLNRWGEDKESFDEYLNVVAKHFKWTITQTIREFEKFPEKTKEKFYTWKEKQNLSKIEGVNETVSLPVRD
jgi:phage recombination protein Bet